MNANFESHSISRRSFLKASGVVGAASILAACGGSSSSTAASTSGAASGAAAPAADAITDYVSFETANRELETWNFLYSQSASDLNVTTNCWDGLLSFDCYGKAVPAIASSWEHNEDSTVWTFHLRDNVDWCDVNGEVKSHLTSKDFLVGLEWVLNALKNEAFNTSMPSEIRQSMKKAVGGKSRVDLAVDQIIQVILDRDMKAGDKLPNEYDLARELGVGRSTLREAIKRLVARNILTARQGAGTFVSEKNGVPEDPLGLTFMMEEGSENLALDLQDIRLMLEPETCAIVARGATPEQIDQMQVYCDEVTRLIEAEEDYSAADAKFHRYLAECSGNHVLPNLIPIIASAIGVVITVTNDEHRSQSGMEHQRIVDAIRRHDPEGAKYSMIAHLNTSRNSMLHSRDNCAAKR